ncbi:autophagy- protein 2, partial [Coemansia sp. S85]
RLIPNPDSARQFLHFLKRQMWPTSWSVSLPSWATSNTLQKRLVKFLLRRTIGQFLKSELDDEHLDVQLSSGQLRLRNVELSEEASRRIEDLVLKAQFADDEETHHDGFAGDDDASDYAKSRLRSGRSNMAESIAMTEGGASILTSPVYIADDFLRAETLGYGEKDAIFINKDVERLVANAHEERAQYF